MKNNFQEKRPLGKESKNQMVPNSPHQRFCQDDDDDDEDDYDDAWDNDVVDVAGDGGGAAEPTNAFAIATIPNITDVITAQILEIIDSEWHFLLQPSYTWTTVPAQSA